MIVHSIRLKNIKSYAEGPEGAGVTVYFEPGTNRIAGKNGHGKTTLIEGLGYALFLKEPIAEERVQLETYFLRAGTKSAEIDVTFSHQGEYLRVERGLGPNNRRLTKVVEVANESTCAEGDKEVSAFICRLFQLPTEYRVSELFWKLVGVRQGRLTWPFDSSPSDAKKFFEPLLDVSVFRDCFDSLKPAIDNLTERVRDREKSRAVVEERIRERSDSVTGMEEKLKLLKESESRVQILNRARDDASETLSRLEQAQTALRAAEIQRSAARESLTLARQKREDAETLLRESLEAAGIVTAAAPGFRSFEDAEKELLTLRTMQSELHRLESEIAGAEKRKAELDGKSDSALSRAELFAKQRCGKESEQSTVRSKVETLRDRLSVTQAEFDRQNDLASRATRSISDIQHFANTHNTVIADGGAAVTALKNHNAAIAARNPSALETARIREETADQKLQLLGRQMAAATADYEALATQLRQIGGGICPFLKEQCRQFDPSKVAGDLKEKGAAIERLRTAKEEAEAAFRVTRRAHDQQRTEDREFSERKSRLEQRVLSFSSSLERLPWTGTTEKVNELRQWITQLEPMPDRPRTAVTGIDFETFEAIYAQNVLLVRALSTWWDRSERTIRQAIDAILEEGRRRAADQRDESNGRSQLQQLESEIATLASGENGQRQIAAEFKKGSEAIETAIADLHERCRRLAFVPDKIVSLQEILEKFRSDYQRYLGAKPAADQRISREKEVAEQKQRKERLDSELAQSESRLLALGKEFSEDALTSARENFQQATAAALTEAIHLTNARRDAEREEVRFREWKEACAKRDAIDREIRRLENAIKLTELARHVLRDAAPIVAQHLCDRIAGDAQRIFNQINQDPVEVKWEAVPRYSLRAVPGDRRFAMLSGGEQTKLALAMTLAMIQEFSGLRFCIFDEPTYGVDAESRDRLGDALLEFQRAAGLEQLLLVSHDDAFDGKIEHTILLRKSATGGTEVVPS